MMQLFTGLPSIFIGYDGDLNYKLNVAGSSNNLRTVQITYQGASASYQYIQVVQEISSVGLWTPVSSIVFTSNTLPIYPTLTGLPKLYNSSSTGMTSSGAANITKVLTDLFY